MGSGKISANGIEIWYEDFGSPENPTVLFIMGASSQCTAWPMELITPVVEAGYHVVRFDNRDIGYSTWIEDYQSNPYTMEDMAADTVGLMDALKVERAHIVGISMGAEIAQLVAINHPERVLSLTSWSSNYWYNDPEVPAMSDEFQAWVTEHMMEPAPVEREQLIERNVEVFRLLSGSRFPFNEERARKSATEEMDRAYNPNNNHIAVIMSSSSRLEGLRRLDVPTLVIHGDEDTSDNYCLGVVCAKVIPGATLFTLKGVGHEIPLETIPETAAVILEHLGRKKGSKYQERYKTMSKKKSHVLNVFMNREYPSIVKTEGIYLYDDQGNKIIDGAGGVILCNIGHGIDEMADTLRDQAKKAAFVYRIDFTNPPLEEAAEKVCELTDFAMDKVFFVSGGSEAIEIAVKIARKFHIDNGNPSKYKIISRWLSYHGMTAGALSWGGMTMRRADYVPMLCEGYHIAPAYCYRCWFNQKPETCGLECAQALENEIMCQGPENIAAFIVEPVSGNSLCGAAPRPEYFRRIREICDRFDVLLILDEVMTGFGRTGKWFGYEQFDVLPDILVIGKGLGGGYFPIGAAVASKRIADTIARNSGIFGAGFSWAGNPMACAITSKTIDYLKEHELVEKCHRVGEYLGTGMAAMSENHPSIGDVRGMGLMRGIEFVRDRESKETIDPDFHFSIQLAIECLSRGLGLSFGMGCDRGQAGDMILLGPPFIITTAQVDDLIGILDEALSVIEKRAGF